MIFDKEKQYGLVWSADVLKRIYYPKAGYRKPSREEVERAEKIMARFRQERRSDFKRCYFFTHKWHKARHYRTGLLLNGVKECERCGKVKRGEATGDNPFFTKDKPYDIS